MRSVSMRLSDITKTTTIPIGFEGENEFTHVNIDCKKMFDEDPLYTPTLCLVSPSGEKYPAVVVRNGDIVSWEVSASDLTKEGGGEIQLAFTHGTKVGKTYVARTRVERSINADGEAPTALANFIIEAGAIVNGIPDAIAEALAEAKASGEFDGDDGFSPVVTITPISGGYTISITDAEGTHTADVMNGTKGDDGYSPTVSITNITGGPRITITDKTGDHSADVMDGADGQDGQDGADGYSPTATVTKSGKVATISITDKNGTTTETVSDGEDGDPSTLIDDTAGSGATGKTWSADKLTSSVMSAINSKYEKPSGGIPASDLASGIVTAVETVSGSTPSITAVANTQYKCGEVSTLSVTLPASGCVDIIFESGSTATVLTITPPSGVTAVKWVGDFDPTSLEANATYEINILDGEWGMAVAWT